MKMKPHTQLEEFRSLILLSFFTTVIVLASCASIPVQLSRDSNQEQSADPLSDEVDSGASTPLSAFNPTTENDIQQKPGDHVPSAAQYAGTVEEERLTALNGLEPAINPMNAEGFENVDPFFIPIVIGGGGWGGRRGGWGGWGGGGWGGRWGGGGWGGRWGGGGWGGRWGGGGWGGGWRG